jgi:hypothetical protein
MELEQVKHIPRGKAVPENTRIDGVQQRIDESSRGTNSHVSTVLVGGIAFTFPLARQCYHG